MLNYIEYLNVPAKIAITLISAFFIMQLIGELLEFKGKVVPEFIKIRKYFKRKKQERATLVNVQETLTQVKSSLDAMNVHYSTDNIKMRDTWIQRVNDSFDRYDKRLEELSVKLDKNNEDTTEILIENMRSTIISFAAAVSDSNTMATREQFNRVFKIYHRYEGLIAENGLTNGEVDIAYRIIQESYETHLRNHSFIEDIRGYTSRDQQP